MKHRWFPLWVFPTVLVFATVTVWLRLTAVETSYEIQQTRGAIRALRKQKEQSELQLTHLRSPRRLEPIAQTQFGMQPMRAQSRVLIVQE